MKQRILSMAVLSLAVFAAAACSEEHNGHNVPDKTYSVGDFYNADGVKGIVYAVDDETGKHGMIVSLDETTAQWAVESAAEVRTGATDERDGAKNRTAVEAIDGWQANYPAFAWCAARNTGGVSGWFLPAFYQLADLFQVYSADPESFNASLTKNGGSAILTDTESEYWSSSENLVSGKEGEAAYFDFGNKSVGFKKKSDVTRVRAVRVF